MDHRAVARAVAPDELGEGRDVRVVVRDLRALGVPATVTTPLGPRSPGRPLREWRRVLSEEGGIRDPWGNVHPFDLSEWDGADPETPLVVAVLAPR